MECFLDEMMQVITKYTNGTYFKVEWGNSQNEGFNSLECLVEK